ncbi:MAG: cyclic nucleotide-binding domain-containing protein [Elusimicrobia bacterium]|nr:cyclic nucleotide-binding domain-containing protein [Elusimicrobiota bacterium]
MLGKFAIEAFLFGMVSAAALPLGALISGIWTPKQKITAFMMAFGAGAIIAVIALDLMANVVTRGDFYPLAIGCITGGILFVCFNKFINARGGFLRKAATTINFLKDEKVKKFEKIFKEMSRVQLFGKLPPEEIQVLLPYISGKDFKKGDVLIKQGTAGDSLFIIDEGTIDIIDDKNNSKKIATLAQGDVLGEMALVTGEPRSVTAVAVSDVKTWLILKEHFDYILQNSPKLAEAVKKLVHTRIDDLHQKETIVSHEAVAWANKAVKNIDTKLAMPTEDEIKKAMEAQKGKPLSIWFGCLVDGIPESLVIGSSLLDKSFSLSLVAGLFISNFPEAFSSSAEMHRQKYSFRKVFWLWSGIMILSGVSAYLGNIFFVNVSPFMFAMIQGLAAGAMLAMVTETMLPEAYYKGGTITGISTLLGLLATVFFKTFEY